LGRRLEVGLYAARLAALTAVGSERYRGDGDSRSQ
jgi:hypothetical protein